MEEKQQFRDGKIDMVVHGRLKSAKKRRLYTTHFLPSAKPRMIGEPYRINGKPSLAYVKDGKVESYISWDEASKEICKDDLPEIDVGF